MIPIYDDNPARLTPLVTRCLIVATTVVFFWQLSLSERDDEAIIYSAGFVPHNLFDLDVTMSTLGIPWPWLTLITSMFLHSGFFHLGGNMLYLWIFGNNVEDAMGHVRFLVFYLVAGVAAALFEGFFDPHSSLPMIGASGAISGVLASYVLIYPRAWVTVITPFWFYPAKISAAYVIGFWFLLQLLNAGSVSAGSPGVAWTAHVGGFAAGLALTPLLSHFPLFGRLRRGPWD